MTLILFTKNDIKRTVNVGNPCKGLRSASGCPLDNIKYGVLESYPLWIITDISDGNLPITHQIRYPNRSLSLREALFWGNSEKFKRTHEHIVHKGFLKSPETVIYLLNCFGLKYWDSWSTLTDQHFDQECSKIFSMRHYISGKLGFQIISHKIHVIFEEMKFTPLTPFLKGG